MSEILYQKGSLVVQTNKRFDTINLLLIAKDVFVNDTKAMCCLLWSNRMDLHGRVDNVTGIHAYSCDLNNGFCFTLLNGEDNK